MKSQVISEQPQHQWVVLGRDSEKNPSVIDTNEYAIISHGQAMLLDPGGIEIFPNVLAELSQYVSIKNIRTLFASHQDPDIISSLPIWLDLVPDIKVHCSWLWASFITHFAAGCKIESIPDEGKMIRIGELGLEVQAIPAHYCHSSGNFSIFDPHTNMLFSGDIGAALVPSHEHDQFVGDFDEHIQYMKAFHQRWMPSTSALRAWVARVRPLNPTMICPQHGSIFSGDNVGKLLDWLENLEVGKWESSKIVEFREAVLV